MWLRGKEAIILIVSGNCVFLLISQFFQFGKKVFEFRKLAYIF
jgi:hypothetical protein